MYVSLSVDTEYNASLQVNVQKGRFKNVTVIQNFLYKTVARSEDINTDDTCLLHLFTKLIVSANTSVVLREEMQIEKFCTEVFVLPKHLITIT